MRETAALRRASLLRNGHSGPAALGLPPVEKDLDLRNVFELTRQCLPQLLLVPRYDNEATCRVFRRWLARRVGLIRHACFLRTAELSQWASVVPLSEAMLAAPESACYSKAI